MTPTPEEITEAETWAELKKIETKRRREWLSEQAKRFGSIKEMASDIGLSRTSLTTMAKSLGVRLPKGKRGCAAGYRNEAKAERYRQCAEDGLTAPEAAKVLEVDVSAVYQAQDRYGIRFKPARHGPKPLPPAANAAPSNNGAPMTMADFARLENEAMKKRSSVG